MCRYSARRFMARGRPSLRRSREWQDGRKGGRGTGGLEAAWQKRKDEGRKVDSDDARGTPAFLPCPDR